MPSLILWTCPLCFPGWKHMSQCSPGSSCVHFPWFWASDIFLFHHSAFRKPMKISQPHSVRHYKCVNLPPTPTVTYISKFLTSYWALVNFSTVPFASDRTSKWRQTVVFVLPLCLFCWWQTAETNWTQGKQLAGKKLPQRKLLLTPHVNQQHLERKQRASNAMV